MNVLSNGVVTPTSGSTTTAFVFRVDYSSTQPPRAAEAVWADARRTIDGTVVTVPLTLDTGTTTAGTFSGSGTLATGSWQVTFRAEAAQGTAVPDHQGPMVTVNEPATSPAPTGSPPPTASPGPTPPPTASAAALRRDARSAAAPWAARTRHATTERHILSRHEREPSAHYAGSDGLGDGSGGVDRGASVG